MKRIVVGSRESRLAVVQSMGLVNYLRYVLPDIQVELVTMKTTGDKILDRTLDKVGGKGLFVKELDQALMDRRIDLAVHCVKDMPMDLAPGTVILGYSHREDPRDVLVLRRGLERLEPGSVIGTASLRRMIQLKPLFPDCQMTPIRGNILTRLQKLDRGDCDALVLAAAGLKRMGLEDRISRYFEPDEIIPAAGQGILAVQGREDYDCPWLQGYADQDARVRAECERAFVRALNGGCTSPVCAHATLQGDWLRVTGLNWEPGTGEIRRAVLEGPAAEARALGIRLAEACTFGDQL